MRILNKISLFAILILISFGMHIKADENEEVVEQQSTENVSEEVSETPIDEETDPEELVEEIEQVIDNSDPTEVSINKLEDSNFLEELEDGQDLNLGIEDPIFFLSENVTTQNYSDSNEICNFINVASSGVSCVNYPVDNITEFPGHIRRGSNSDNYEQTKINADFAILRADVLKAAVDGKGPLAGAPDLDMVMHLNGRYLFLFADVSRNAFVVEQLMNQRGLQNRTLVVGYLNDSSREIFRQAVAPLFPKTRVSYTKIAPNRAENNICYRGKVDIFIYSGAGYDPELQNIINKCSTRVVPLTFTEKTLATILNNNPVFSSANVKSYYDATSIINFVNSYISLQKKYKEIIEKQKSIPRASKGRETPNPTATRAERSPAVRTRTRITRDQIRQRPKEETPLDTLEEGVAQPKYDEEVIIKNENLKYLPGRSSTLSRRLPTIITLRNDTIQQPVGDEDTLQVSLDSSIKTFGVRNVLVASRYATKDHVIQVFDALIKNYFSIRERLLTKDVVNFNVEDMVIGTYKNVHDVAKYHPGVFEYGRTLLQSSAPKTTEQTLAIRALAANLSSDLLPPFYGPQSPSTEQLSVIYEKVRELNRQKRELNAIRIFQRDVKNIEDVLQDIASGQPVEGGVLQAFGLQDVDIYSVADGQSAAVLEDEFAEVDALIEAEQSDLSNEEGAEGATDENAEADTEEASTEEVAPEEGEELSTEEGEEETSEEVTEDEENEADTEEETSTEDS